MLHNWFIPSHLVKCFLATLTKFEKLRSDLSVITICLAKLYVYRRPWANERLSFQCSLGHFTWSHTYVSLLLPTFSIKALLCNTVFLYSWQRRVAQRHTQNALLCFHCNSGYANTSQCYVTRTLSCFIVHSCCAVVTMEKVVIYIIYRKDTVSAINCTHYRIHHILGRCKLRCTVSRADKITEACFTSLVYIDRESNA